jgi:hypothetical protein
MSSATSSVHTARGGRSEARGALIAVRATVAQLSSKLSDRLAFRVDCPCLRNRFALWPAPFEANSLRCCIPTRGRCCSAQPLAPWSSLPASYGRKFLELPKNPNRRESPLGSYEKYEPI